MVEQISQEKLAATTLEPGPSGIETVKLPAPQTLELHREPDEPRIGTITINTRELRSLHRQLGTIIEQLDQRRTPAYELWKELNR